MATGFIGDSLSWATNLDGALGMDVGLYIPNKVSELTGSKTTKRAHDMHSPALLVTREQTEPMSIQLTMFLLLKSPLDKKQL